MPIARFLSWAEDGKWYSNELKQNQTIIRGDQEKEFRSALEAAVESFGLHPLTDQQSMRLVEHYSMLCRWNQRVNLTRIIEPGEAARLHYAESMFGARFIQTEQSVLDIGSGAGFPAIPIAVARPDIQVTALEANQKKSLFLTEAKDELGLVNLNVVTARLEEFDWDGYDVLASRALERAETVFQYVIERMSAQQGLMLYCAPELVVKLERPDFRRAVHPIPHSEARLIAIFFRE